MRIRVHGGTDPGRVRENNEDAFLVEPDGSLLIVCDGVGGHSKGEVASAMAIDTVKKLLTVRNRRVLDAARPALSDVPQEASDLAAAVRLASTRIHAVAADVGDHRGMGTTLVALKLERDGTFAAVSVGDSRVYRVRNGVLSQLSRDHTFLNELIEDREISKEDARDFKQKNVISRALGMGPAVKVDLRVDAVQKGDIYLLCSDGLHGVLDDGTIAGLLSANAADLGSAVQALLDQANARGGPDNVTVVTAVVDEAPDRPARSPLKLELSDNEREYPRRRRALTKLFALPKPRRGRLPLFLTAGAAVVVLVVLALVIRAVRGVGSRPVRYGSLRVSAQSAGLVVRDVTVRIEGLSTVGPVFDSLRCDSAYGLVVSAPGYLVHREKVTVTDTAQEEKTVLLEPAASFEVYVGGLGSGVVLTVRRQGQDDLTLIPTGEENKLEGRITPGRYTFIVDWPGGEPFEFTETVGPRQRILAEPEERFHAVDDE